MHNVNSPKSLSFVQYLCDLNTGIVLGIMKQQGNKDDGIIKPDDVQRKTLSLIYFIIKIPNMKFKGIWTPQSATLSFLFVCNVICRYRSEVLWKVSIELLVNVTLEELCLLQRVFEPT